MESIKLSSADGGVITLVSIEETAQINLAGGLTGPEGATGPAGENGAGVPFGGDEGQVLVKQSITGFDTVWRNLNKTDVGLTNVDNTSDLSKPISTAVQTALDAKANNSSVVHLTGDESIAGIKSFINQAVAAAGMTIPIDPVELTDATNKQYVDESIISGFKARGWYDVRLGVVVDGTLYRATGDGVTDDAPALQQIMDYISDNGGGEMRFPSGTYMCRSSVWIRDGVLVNGLPFHSVLTSDVDPKIQDDDGVPDNLRMYGIFRSDQVTPIPTGWGCENVTFKGNVTEHPTVPQANRTRDPSPFHAIKINGSKAPDTSDDFGQPTSGPLISNIFIRNITVKDMASLPITIWGVSDRNITTECFFDNNKDIGYVYNDEVIFTSNHSSNSSDNGVSLSRGNRKVVCVGNTFENAALFGIWYSGYNSDIGPTQFTCSANSVINCGRSCLNLDYGPSYGVISGNYFYQGYHRGPWDALSDTGIDGMTIAGAAGGVHATGLVITSNLIDSPARNGIAFKELDNSLIALNEIRNPGTAFKANGTTPILSTDTQSNNGICPIATGSYSNVRILDNYLVEDRDTPLGNWPISSANTGGTYPRGNRFTPNSWRNKNNTVDVVDTVMSGNDIIDQYDGDDASFNHLKNMKGAGKFIVRNNDGSGINNVNTSTSSSAAVTYLYAAGSSNTGYIGASTATRQDPNSSSVFALRVLANGALTPAGTSALFYLGGLATHSMGFVGFGGGLRTSRTEISDTAYTILLQDYIVAYITLTTAHNVTLPDATTCAGQTIIVKDEVGSASTANLTLVTVSGQTIDGTSTRVININFGQIAVYSNGINWRIQGGLYNATTQKLVDTSTSQTIAGVKIFSSEPVVPTPTSATSAANKAYVDAAVGSPSVRGFTTCVSDFMANVSTPPWIATAISSGTISAGTGSSSHPGIARMASSTTTNSGFRLQTNTTAMVIGGGESTDIVFNVPTTANTTCYLGFHNSSTNAAPVDGAYITISGTTLQGNTSANSTTSTTGTTYTITQSAWYHLNITVNAAANLVTYTLYDMSETQLWQDTLSTNIPSTSRTLGHGTCSTNSGTSAVAVLEVDYMSLQINRTLTR